MREEPGDVEFRNAAVQPRESQAAPTSRVSTNRYMQMRQVQNMHAQTHFMTSCICCKSLIHTSQDSDVCWYMHKLMAATAVQNGMLNIP